MPPTGSREPVLRLSIRCECLDRDYWVRQKALPALRELSAGYGRRYLIC